MVFKEAEIPVAQRPWDIADYLEAVLTEPTWTMQENLASVVKEN
jgi:hypothetical protein